MSSKTERTFIMVKVDGVQRGLIGEIIKRFEQKGYKLVALKFLKPSLELVQQHYRDHISKDFYHGLCNFMSSGPVAAMVWEGLNVVAAGRQMLGETDPINCAPGTIRGVCVDIKCTVCHGSDGIEAAQREIKLWFKNKELVTWEPTTSQWDNI